MKGVAVEQFQDFAHSPRSRLRNKNDFAPDETGRSDGTGELEIGDSRARRYSIATPSTDARYGLWVEIDLPAPPVASSVAARNDLRIYASCDRVRTSPSMRQASPAGKATRPEADSPRHEFSSVGYLLGIRAAASSRAMQ